MWTDHLWPYQVRVCLVALLTPWAQQGAGRWVFQGQNWSAAGRDGSSVAGCCFCGGASSMLVVRASQGAFLSKEDELHAAQDPAVT